MNGVKVPTYLYKRVYDTTTNKACAHWQENREGGDCGSADQLQGTGETHGRGVFAKKCTAALSRSKGRVSGGGINRSFPTSTREHP